MTEVEKIIKECKIKPEKKSENGKTVLTGRIRFVETKNYDRMDIAEMKPQILAYFQAEIDAQEEREAKIAAIEGLQEIRKARAEIENYHCKFQASFEGENAVGGLFVGKKPQYDLDAMAQKYPRAMAYLKAEDRSHSANYKYSIIGEKAKERIINEPDNYETIIAEMEAEIKKATNYWD